MFNKTAKFWASSPFGLKENAGHLTNLHFHVEPCSKVQHVDYVEYGEGSQINPEEASNVV